MIEFDVDMGYLLEEGELDSVVLNDENGEHEPMEFRLSGGECELAYGENDDGVDSWFTQCGGRFAATFEDGRMVHPKFCQLCGRKAVER